MATGGAPGRGAALGRGFGLVLLTGGLAIGCGGAGPDDGTPAGARAATPSDSSPSATPPEKLCARIVAYWSREVLDSDAYGDYQSMGLSNGQYAILREVVDAARAEKERAGREPAEELIDREAREGCEDLYVDGAPSKGPWQ